MKRGDYYRYRYVLKVSSLVSLCRDDANAGHLDLTKATSTAASTLGCGCAGAAKKLMVQSCFSCRFIAPNEDEIEPPGIVVDVDTIL